MTKYAALDVSMEQTAICVVDVNGRKLAEGKVPTDPDAIKEWLTVKAGETERIGMSRTSRAHSYASSARRCSNQLPQTSFITRSQLPARTLSMLVSE